MLGLCLRSKNLKHGDDILSPSILSIDFPFHFILSPIDVYKDTVTRDKLIFPSAITRLLRHFSVFYPKSPYFMYMYAIDITNVKWSVAQLCPR